MTGILVWSDHSYRGAELTHEAHPEPDGPMMNQSRQYLH